MALGKVDTISLKDPAQGTVIEDETGTIYPFNDPNFPKQNLQPGDPCTFDVTLDPTTGKYVASNIKAYNPNEKDINTTVDGPIDVNPGETLKVGKGGMVNGSINIASNGIVIIEDGGSVNGDITVGDGSFLKVKNKGMVKGNVSVQSAMGMKVVNGGMINGNITVTGANKVIIGNDKGGGMVKGNLNITHARHVNITLESTINCGA